MALSILFQLYRDNFDWWGKPEYSEKTTDPTQDTDCTGSRSNNHMIMTTPAPVDLYIILE